jgi:FAD/FMN-containing dehydrogenase
LVVTASQTTNSDLWRALKGGSNNFGIVTQFTARCFPSIKIWSGFIYVPAFNANKVLACFYEFVSRRGSLYDSNAAGPIVSFSYIQQLGFQVIAVNLVYTKVPENENRWPSCFKTSGFASFWRFWSTCKVRTLTEATDELNGLNPPGRRQTDFATVTIKSDPATIAAAHAAYHKAIASLRSRKVKELVWTLVLQPFLPDWVRRGDPNPLGLQDIDEPLVIVSFTVNWAEKQDDEFVKTTTRKVVEEIEAFAAANKTDHPYRYLNYCAKWQKPFKGYGAENWQFLKDTSRKYDPEGLFQKGCVGGFKLALDEEHQ